MPMKKAASHIFACLMLAMAAAAAAGCRFLPEFSNDEEVVTAERRTFVRLDTSQIPAPADNQNARDQVEKQITFLSEFVRDANDWYLPFAASYLPSLRTGQEKRIIPLLNDGALAVALNQRDIAVNLFSTSWSGDFSTAVPLLRQELIRSAVNKILAAGPVVPVPVEQQKKDELIRGIFAAGVPVYLSSFGMRAGESPLTFALAGERDVIEEQFNILREPERDLEKAKALAQAGIWMCFKIETQSGTSALIQAVQEGPRGLYEHYLATRPGILLSLEPVPVQTAPIPGDLFITH